MSENFTKIVYIEETKTWKSINYPYKDFTQHSLYEVLWNSLKRHNPDLILEFNWESKQPKKAKDIFEQGIMVAVNLQRMGLTKGDVVLIFSLNNNWISALTVGCLLIGVLVNFFEVHLEADDIDVTFQVLNPTIILYEKQWQTKVLSAVKRKRPSNLKQLLTIDGSDAVQNSIYSELLKPLSAAERAQFQYVKVENPEKEIALLLLTSGSTGPPKVVQLSHSVILHGLMVWYSAIDHLNIVTKDHIIMSFSPLRWISQIQAMLLSLIQGAKRVYTSTQTIKPEESLEILCNQYITHLFITPSFLEAILKKITAVQNECLGSLNVIQIAGEPVPDELVEITRKYIKQAKVYYTYGMTEMGGCITNDTRHNGGQILPGIEMQILDDNLETLTVNESGRVAFKLLYPFLGYKAINNAPYFTNNGFFITGDYGYVDNNNELHLLGRYKDLIKVDDLILIPYRVERWIKTMPEIQNVYLTGYDFTTPHNVVYNAALFIILKMNISLSVNRLKMKIREHLKGNLCERQIAIIRDIYFVDKVPLTSCGKIDRESLRQQAIQFASYK